ncbi:MAG: hypothetical protein ABIQ12_02585 [Opitutaceae bacterium]
MKPSPPRLASFVSAAKLCLVFVALGLTARAQRDSGGRDRGDGDGTGFVRQNPLPIFFPPNPPPLGRMFTRATGAPAGRFPPPAELAAYIGDPFYPQLSTRLFTKSLAPKLSTQLDTYRNRKLALLGELRGELDLLRDAPPEARQTALAELARRQAPKLAELEQAAEDLRRDLISGETHWSALREWKLGDSSRRGFSPFEIAQVMRGYAFYQPGLGAAQRRLLREIFLELTAAANSTANAAAAQPYLFFSPEPARVLLPDDMPADVAAKVAAYQTKKSQLKKELYDAVTAEDGRKLGWLRPSGMKPLAEQQAKAIEEVETLAEEIRRGLAQLAEPTAIGERSPLSASLQHRVTKLLADYASLQKEASTRVEEILAEARGLPMQATYRFEGDGLRFLIGPARAGRGGRGGVSPETVEQIAAVRARVSAVADDYGRQVADLINEKDAIRTEIARTLGTTRAAVIDDALTVATRVAMARETDALYHDYKIAVFQPGLSPAQRRLLFDSVVERLDLPLPRAELQPTARAASW